MNTGGIFMPATDTLLKEFEHFFQHYQKVWNGCNAEDMNAILSKEIAIRWAGPDATISDWATRRPKLAGNKPINNMKVVNQNGILKYCISPLQLKMK